MMAAAPAPVNVSLDTKISKLWCWIGSKEAFCGTPEENIVSSSEYVDAGNKVWQ